MLALPRFRTRVVIGLWLIQSIVGVLISLLAMMRLAGIRGFIVNILPVGEAQVGGALMWFIGGLTLALIGLWGAYSRTVHARPDHLR